MSRRFEVGDRVLVIESPYRATGPSVGTTGIVKYVHGGYGAVVRPDIGKPTDDSSEGWTFALSELKRLDPQ